MSILVIILLIIIFCWPWISRAVSRWISNFMSRRAEDMIRRMMGMPPRDKRGRRGARSAFSGAGRKRSRETAAAGERPDRERTSGKRYSIAALMQLVAVDVTYTEIKEFSSTSIGTEGRKTFQYIREEQITDVKFEEIKDRRS